MSYQFGYGYVQPVSSSSSHLYDLSQHSAQDQFGDLPVFPTRQVGEDLSQHQAIGQIPISLSSQQFPPLLHPSFTFNPGTYFGPYAPAPLPATIAPPSPINDDFSPLTSPSSFDGLPEKEPELADIPGKTNWAPSTIVETVEGEETSLSSTSSSLHASVDLNHKIHPPPHSASPQNSLGRSQRAAASKARSNISTITESLRSPSRTTTYTASTRPVSRATSVSGRGGHSRASSRASFNPSEPHTACIPPGPIPFDQLGFVDGTTLRVPITGTTATKGRKGLGYIELKNHRGFLLPTDPGALLEVNELLILQPPTINPIVHGKHPARNQYSSEPCPEEYQSVYEMYTCRVCSKTYDGKNARSVARRHLQDKHGVPLSVQTRRTRWDGDLDRPKDQYEAYARGKKAKREWATKRRLLARLEKIHADFLAQYGPGGMTTPSNTHLVAANLRQKGEGFGGEESSTRVDWWEMPKHLRDSVASIEKVIIPPITDEPVQHVDPGASLLQPVLPQLRHLRRAKNESISNFSSTSSTSELSAITQSTDHDIAINLNHSPSHFAHSAPEFGLKRTPMSGARTTGQELTVPSGADWTSWGAASYVDEEQLRKVIEQHHANTAMTSEEAITSNFAAHTALSVNTGSEGSIDVSPEPLVDMDTTTVASNQQWITNGRPVWSMAQSYAVPVPIAARSYMTPGGTEPSIEALGQESDAEGEIDVVAAESLLDLRSTPARPDGTTESSQSSYFAQLTSDINGSSQTANAGMQGLLDAPEITPRPTRPIRSHSMAQAFGSSRQSMTRSQSYNTKTLDDPFAFSPSQVFGISGTNRKKRRSTIASPSPLSLKRKKEKVVHSTLDGSPRAPMSAIHPNFGINTMSQISAPLRQATASSYQPAQGSAMWYQLHHVSSGDAQATLGTAYTTPMRPQRATVMTDLGEMSVTKAWLMSSPAVEGTAVSLGTAPDWKRPSGTPGVRGIEAETPVRGGRR